MLTEITVSDKEGQMESSGFNAFSLYGKQTLSLKLTNLEQV